MEIVDVEENLNSELKSDFRGLKDGFVQVGDRKWFYPSEYREAAAELKNFEVRPDDIWITGYPRSGTTLNEDLVWLLVHDMDFEGIKNSKERVKLFEHKILLNKKTSQEVEKKFPEEAAIYKDRRNTLNALKNYETRRVIKTHLPFELLPPDVLNKGCKIIYICRFPKDVCVSQFQLQSTNRNIDFTGDFQKFWRHFRNGNTIFGPYFEHVKQGFDRIGTQNFMFTFYEEFNGDNKSHIQKLSQFLEIPITDNELEALEKFINIDNYRKLTNILVKDKDNVAIKFVRKGKVGGWRDLFTAEINNEADEWIETNTKRIGIQYLQQKL